MLGEREPRLELEVFNAVGDAAFFRRLIGEWTALGANVTLQDAISDSDYRAAAGLFPRLALRWKMYPRYAWSCWRRVRSNSARKVVRLAVTNPFFLPALVARAGGRNAASVNLLYDLYPDALIQAGKIAAGGIVAQRCADLTRYALSHCSATVFLGPRLRKYAESKYGPARRAWIIPVGADGSPFRDSPPASRPSETKPTILYCGQLGRMHEVDTIASVLLAGWSGVEFVFRASGAGYQRLRNRVGPRPGLIFSAPLADRDWQSAMKRASVALVTMAAGAENIVMPSKTYSAMVAGQAVLAICPRNSDLADVILSHDCGWVVEPNDVRSLLRIVEVIAKDPDQVMRKRQRAFECGHRLYDMEVVAAQWMNLFDEIICEPSHASVARPFPVT